MKKVFLFTLLHLKYAINFDKLDKEVPYKFAFTVLHNNKQTDVTLTSPKLIIDHNGNFSPITAFKLNGEMSKGRLSYMLPVNFVFENYTINLFKLKPLKIL